MGNKNGKISPEKATPPASTPFIEGEFDFTPREQVTKEDEQYLSGIIYKNNSLRLQQQQLIKSDLIEELLKTNPELESSFKKVTSRRTALENVEKIKNQTLPTIPLVGEIVNKIIDLGMIIGKRYLERTNSYLLCLFAFNNISEIFEPLATIDNFYEIIISMKNKQKGRSFDELLEKYDFDSKLDKYKEFRTTVEEIIAESSVMMLDQNVINKINNTFTQGDYKDFYCSQPNKYKLEDPTFFETIISTAIEIKQQNKNTGKIFTIPQLLIEELTRKLIGLSINFSVIMAGYQDLKNNFPYIKHNLTQQEAEIIKKLVDNIEMLSMQTDEIPDQQEDEILDQEAEMSENQGVMPEQPVAMSENPPRVLGGTRRKKRKSKRYPKHNRRKTRKSLKKISKDLKKSKRRF